MGTLEGMEDTQLIEWFESLSKDIGSVRREVGSLQEEMKEGFTQVNQRLDRIDSALVLHGWQLASGSRTITGFAEWVGKADADYVRVLTELSDLRQRVAKLEGEKP